ncbi:hypothetical protein LDO26_14520 [Luteimonas sp. BDR2-5]|uniref:hypothetical protein n=1 Tax=Proluteimonas luteida TaxID=2878685 RepID=UPI001E53AA2D|nr:hypothetical protein [Luteimonas sp. BDR2-5]MCD9029406.1 hypothetical protein [Luteimonas sp. BDR2-5]
MSAYSFTKLFSSITKSTVWCEPHTTVRVWIAMLADCDPDGCVHASVPGLANLARVTVAECEAALATFLGPDPYSRTPDHEGRRIEVIPGGWRLLNHKLYRDRRDEGARRVQNREAAQRYRDRGRQQPSAEMLTPDDEGGSSAHSRCQIPDTDKKQKQEHRRARGSRLPQEWQPGDADFEWALNERPDLDIRKEGERFRDYWIAKAGKDGIKADWPATWRNWIRNANIQVGHGRKCRSESRSARIERENGELDRREAQSHAQRFLAPAGVTAYLEGGSA